MVQTVNSNGLVTCSGSNGSNSSSSPLKSEVTDLSLLKPGLLVSARVRSVAEEGLVVNFCGLTGVIHKHHLGVEKDESKESKDEDGDAKDSPFVKNQQLLGRVLAVLPAAPPIPPIVQLTLLPHLVEWLPADLEKQAVGDRLEGEILDFQRKYGCRVRCKTEGMIGFCPMSKLADQDQDVAAASVVDGQVAQYRVLSYNFLENTLVLTRRPADLLENTLVSVTELVPGQLVTGTVSKVADHGIHVKLSSYVTGHVHLRQLTDVPLASVPKRLSVGSKVKCRVLHVHQARRQLTLTAKKSLVQSDFQLTSNSSAMLNMVLIGYVSSIHDYGAMVSFYGGARGSWSTKKNRTDSITFRRVQFVVSWDVRLRRSTPSEDAALVFAQHDAYPEANVL
ncbi:unnamed protein product [Durusdinium trenchii]|uniref:S1 motif domain-containing protein n=1 Tax=Durusdinium trenchii TaxID=1381693 RepID=A0ABP0HYR2_9DINO